MSETTNQIMPANAQIIDAPAVPAVAAAAPIATNLFSDEGFNLIADLTTAKTQYCSMVTDTDESKQKLFNAMNNPDKRIADMINMPIAVRDIYIEVVNCTNQETGEVTVCPRIVLIDDKGVSYQAVSIGIYSAVKKLIQVYGEPSWEKPVKVIVKNITKGDRKMLTLNVAG